MRFIGNVKKLNDALVQGEAIAKSEGRTFVYEKAKCRDFPSPKRYVCYRGWLDMDDKSVRVISIQQWNKERKR